MCAVHESQIDPANEYTQYVKKGYLNVVCTPDLPIEEYEPLCLNRQCKEIIRSYRFLLVVPEQPVAGQPFWIGMSFRFPVDAEQVDAKFFPPDNVRVIQGKETWSGPVKAHEDYVMWVQVQTNTTGTVNLSGWAGIKVWKFCHLTAGGNPARFDPRRQPIAGAIRLECQGLAPPRTHTRPYLPAARRKHRLRG